MKTLYKLMLVCAICIGLIIAIILIIRSFN